DPAMRHGRRHGTRFRRNQVSNGEIELPGLAHQAGLAELDEFQLRRIERSVGAMPEEPRGDDDLLPDDVFLEDAAEIARKAVEIGENENRRPAVLVLSHKAPPLP